ncbi:MAG: Holliday junction resolvase RuvX [Kistimonas sp.]|nr:Holliday junction resolvase RuvX [Kistimonas sp.]
MQKQDKIQLPPYQSVMGFDFGTRRIGVAVGQAVTRTATAAHLVPAKAGVPDWGFLSRIVEQWQPDAFIVGLALNEDGSDSDMSRQAHQFGRRLAARFHRNYHCVNEFLTSFEAEKQAQETGGPASRKPVDAQAARLILESWMNGHEGHQLLRS